MITWARITIKLKGTNNLWIKLNTAVSRMQWRSGVQVKLFEIKIYYLKFAIAMWQNLWFCSLACSSASSLASSLPWLAESLGRSRGVECVAGGSDYLRLPRAGWEGARDHVTPLSQSQPSLGLLLSLLLAQNQNSRGVTSCLNNFSLVDTCPFVIDLVDIFLIQA